MAYTQENKTNDINKWYIENNVDGLNKLFSQKVKIKPRMRA